ncbi:DoxX family protein [Celerinatantimonas sp. YJH-8]|uniref:DoxX family protein n=1 Tax=Celerinatantimonas sp. YJH-8 TaxID=3228714 RepID=UPI0038C059E7
MITALLNWINRVFDRPDLAKLLLRLSIAMLLFHGFHKLEYGIGGIQQMLVAYGLPAYVGDGVYVGEIIAPILIVLGVLCRPAAIFMMGTMVVAWLMVDIDATFQVDRVGAWAIENLMFYFMMGAVLLFCGPGRYSLGSPTWR